MIKTYPSVKRGQVDRGWLQSDYAFSFDTFYDPERVGYRTLKVLNEEKLQGGKGFGSRTHQDVEIVTLVLEGVLEYQDHLGNTSVMRPGDLHVMSAGKGIEHAEYNLSSTLPAHFIQLWFQPENHGYEPVVQQKQVSSAAKWGQWALAMSRNGRAGSLVGHQDVDLYLTLLEKGEEIVYKALSDRYYWIQVLSGKFTLGDLTLKQGDSVTLENESSIVLASLAAGEVLLLDFL